MKRIIHVHLCAMAFYMAANSARSQVPFTYTTNANAITIIGYSGSGGQIAIPAQINGYPVTSIGSFAFFWTTITGITIPNSVTNIGDDAFYGCNDLTTLVIPDSVISLGQEAFMQSGLSSVMLGKGVTSIGDDAFAWCFSLPAINVSLGNPAYTSVAGILFNKSETILVAYPAGNSASSYTIPNTVTNIGYAAFFQCSRLSTVVIPSSVTKIGGDAFFMCWNLGNLIIPASITSVGEYAFASTPLTSVTIPANLTNIGEGAFAFCSSLDEIAVNPGNPAYFSAGGVLLDGAQTTLIQYPAGRTESSYTLPFSVTNIGATAFSGCANLANVTVDLAVANIGKEAFDGCGLTSITIPANVVSIEDDAFDNCTGLTNVTCQGNAPICGLTEFTSDNGAIVYYYPGTSGWSSSFGGVPAVMLSPPNPAGSLQVLINPSGAIAAGAYWQVDGGISQPSLATVVGLSVGNHTVSFGNANGWNRPSNQTISVSANSIATATGIYTQPGRAQFTYITNNGAITITGYVGSDGAVDIPETINGYAVTAIGDGSFGDSGVTSITIPGSVTNIGEIAFYRAWSLQTLIADPSNAAYSSSNGVLFDKAQGTLVAYPPGLQGSYTIPTSVTNIGKNAFYECYNLTGITIGTSVTRIGDEAFAEDRSLRAVTVPASVTDMGVSPFGGCSSLTAILVDMNNPAFRSDAGVLFNRKETRLVQYPAGNGSVIYALPTTAISIAEQAFASCQHLTFVTIPNSVTNIETAAFAFCTGLTNVSIGDGVRSIGSEAFWVCSNLADVSFGKSLSTIGAQSFAGTKLTTVTIPASVTSIESVAFASISMLTGVYFQGDAPRADCSVFSGDNLVTLYYLVGKAGWSNPFACVPTAEWTGPPTLVLGINSLIGAFKGQPGFLVSGPTNSVVVVEANVNMARPFWQPLATNTLIGGASYFTDPQWTNYPARFYRVRTQ